MTRQYHSNRNHNTNTKAKMDIIELITRVSKAFKGCLMPAPPRKQTPIYDKRWKHANPLKELDEFLIGHLDFLTGNVILNPEYEFYKQAIKKAEASGLTVEKEFEKKTEKKNGQKNEV